MKTNLRFLNSETPAPFSNQKIIVINDYEISKGLYFKDEERLDSVSIPINNIVGHDQGYGDMMWGDCLNGKYLKRINLYLQELEENPSYYLEKKEKDGVNLIQIENDFFIGGGKHRIVISRYFAHFNQKLFGDKPMLHGVNVTKRNVDYELVKFNSQFETLAKMHPNLNIEIAHKSWTFPQHNILIYKKGEYRPEVFARDELETLVDALYRPSLVKKIRGDRFHKMQSIRSCFMGT